MKATYKQSILFLHVRSLPPCLEGVGVASEIHVDERMPGRRVAAAVELVPAVHSARQGVGNPFEPVGRGAEARGRSRVVGRVRPFEMFTARGLQFGHDDGDVTKVKRDEHGVSPGDSGSDAKLPLEKCRS